MPPEGLSQEEFAFLAAWLSRRTGLVLTMQRADFADIRLKPVMHRFGFKTVSALVGELRHNSEALSQAVCEAVTVNDTAFFRDPDAFATLRDSVLPELIARRMHQRTVRIWCAACATGQEAYSLAMLLDDMELVAAGWQVELIATDINTDTIARAKAGLYSRMEIERGLTPRRVSQCLFPDGDQWRVRQHLRRMVAFKPFNLLDSMGWLWQVDLVVCRNVLMYFDADTRANVMSRIAEVMAADSCLVVGTSEMIIPPTGLFERVHNCPGFYTRVKGGQRLIVRNA